MKKKLSLLIVLVLILSLAFTGCGKKDPTPDIGWGPRDFPVGPT